MRTRLALVSLLLAVSACGPQVSHVEGPAVAPELYQALSAGSVGCVPGRVTIEDQSTVVVVGAIVDTWTATCAGVPFACTRDVYPTGSSHVACSPMRENATSGGVFAPPPAPVQ